MSVLDKINDLPAEKAQTVLSDFVKVYFNKGFGLMNKTEIETLLYFVLQKNGILKGKCFDDSIELEVPEAKVRRLIYESEIKYYKRTEEERDRELREKLGECLKGVKFVKNNTQIKFVMEDKYLRVALNAKLRANGLFADTSFNTDIITLDEPVLNGVVQLLVPNVQVEDVLENLKAANIDDEARQSKDKNGIISSFIKNVFVKASVEGIKQLAGLLIV